MATYDYRKGKERIEDILDKEGSIKVGCQFCNKEYVFDRADAEKLFE